MSMEAIERAAAEYATKRDILNRSVQGLQDAFARAREKFMPAIRERSAVAATARRALTDLLEAHPELFRKPKTIVLSGIRVGFKKAPGAIRIADPDVTVRLIRKHHPELADTLIKTTETVVKSALATLSAAELKKLGVTVTDTTDQAVAQSTDGEIDKLVEALLKDEPAPAEAAA